MAQIRVIPLVDVAVTRIAFTCIYSVLVALKGEGLHVRAPHIVLAATIT